MNLALIAEVHAELPAQPVDYPPVPTRTDATRRRRSCSTRVRPAGCGKIQFHDWRSVYAGRGDVPNVAVFTEQADVLVAARDGDRRTRPQLRGPGLPAGAGRAVHAGRLRAADPRAGGHRRPGPRPRRLDLRRVRARLLRGCGGPQRQGRRHRRAGGVGRRVNPLGRARRRAGRPGVGAGQGRCPGPTRWPPSAASLSCPRSGWNARKTTPRQDKDAVSRTGRRRRDPVEPAVGVHRALLAGDGVRDGSARSAGRRHAPQPIP